MSNSKQWTDPLDGAQYDLSHLESRIYTYQIKLNKSSDAVEVPVRIFYSLHCYSKEAKDDETVHFEERRKSSIEQRTFCNERWEFSKRLPNLIQGLQSKICFTGGSQDVLYRLEEPELRNRVCGWYVCLRLNYRPKKTPRLELSIRSVHYRTNKPVSIRGPGQRFYVLIAKLLNRHK